MLGVSRLRIFLFCLFLLSFGVGNAWASGEDILRYLEQTGISQEAKKALERSVRSDPNARSWIGADNIAIYALCVMSVPQDEELDVQMSLNADGMNKSRLGAIAHLARFLNNDRVDRSKYPDSDAVDYALRLYYEKKISSGIQSRSDLLKKDAVSLVWLDKSLADNLGKLSPDEGQLTGDYCTYLYRTAGELYKAGNFKSALDYFHKIHYMDWANVEAYLSAASCFMKLNQKADAVCLTNEVLKTLETKMTADDLAKAGKILYGAGQQDEGFAVLDKAYNRLKNGM